MRIKQIYGHTQQVISKMKNKILPTCLKGNYKEHLGEFSYMSLGMFGAVLLTRNKSDILNKFALFLTHSFPNMS